MFIKRRSWDMPENQATDEGIYMNRRSLLRTGGILMAGGLIGGLAGCGEEPSAAMAKTPGKDLPNPNLGLYPAERNGAYKLDRDLTPEKLSSTYNNFYEFGSHKRIAKAAQKLVIRPWEIVIDGVVEKDIRIDADELIAKIGLEERLYRHRCVEAWSMAVPWTGFPLKKLVEMAKPLSKAKYVRFETFKNPDVATGQKQSWYPWPYVEGVTMAEATNDLAFIATGIYGKPMAKQFGAPVRLVLPWKYGFKSIKSIVRISFTEKRPVSFWEEINAVEYGFWANVNPKVPHRRWSQATEQPLGKSERIPTLLFNGYGEQVAHLYKGMKGRLYT